MVPSPVAGFHVKRTPGPARATKRDRTDPEMDVLGGINAAGSLLRGPKRFHVKPAARPARAHFGMYLSASSRPFDDRSC